MPDIACSSWCQPPARPPIGHPSNLTDRNWQQMTDGDNTAVSIIDAPRAPLLSMMDSRPGRSLSTHSASHVGGLLAATPITVARRPRGPSGRGAVSTFWRDISAQPKRINHAEYVTCVVVMVYRGTLYGMGRQCKAGHRRTYLIHSVPLWDGLMVSAAFMWNHLIVIRAICQRCDYR